MQAGLLNKRLVLQRRTTTVDAEGTPTDAWVSMGSVWAQVTPTAGTERIVAGEVEAQITHQVTLRYRADLDPGVVGVTVLHNTRLLLGNRILDVRSGISPEEHHVELDLICIERQR